MTNKGLGSRDGLHRLGASTRSVTLVLSAVLAVGVVAAMVTFAVRSTPGEAADEAAAPPPRVIEDLLGPNAASGSGMTIQITDEDDPTRLAAELLAARYDPDGPLHRKVTEPRAWLFGEDGSSWYIEADRGRFFVPEGSDTPQEGFLEGNVRARRYDPVESGRPEPGKTPASLTATTDEALRFNLELLHFETDGVLKITGERLEFEGRGAFVVLNEQQESITYLRVDQGERLVYTPLAEDTGAAPAGVGEVGAARSASAAVVPVAFMPAASDASPDSTREPAPAPPTAPASAEPKIDLYEITFEDEVALRSGTREVSSDLLTVWARLIDNKIPERSSTMGAPSVRAVPGGLPGVLAALATAAPPVFDPEALFEDSGSVRAADSEAGGEGSPEPAGVEPEAPAEPEPVVLTWSGPLEVSPIEVDDVEPLSRGDDIALRFDADEGPVHFTDEKDGSRGRALSAWYYAGRERIELSGPGGQVELASPGAGVIRDTNKMTIELGSGYVSVPAPGVMMGKDHDETPGAESPQRIRWSGEAEFVFGVADGRMTDRIERASFTDEVLGENRDATLRGSRLDALFDSGPDEDPRLVQMNIADARADDGRGGAVSGNTLEVHFARGTHGEELDPTRAIITGDALALREGRERIRADRIDAGLGRNEDGDVVVTIAEAEGAVEFDDGEGVAGEGESLWADAMAERAVISGEGAWVQRDETRITGGEIELDGPKRRVDVTGAGTFSHKDSAEGERAGRSIETAWTERMHFDDVAGLVECVGGVTAETVGPDRTRDRVEASRIVMGMDPAEPGGNEDGNGSDRGGASIDQRLRRAIAYGTADEPAVVESRKVDPQSPEDEPRVSEILHLTGAEIRFAAKEDRLDVPTAGKLFILDRRPEEAASTGGNELAAPGGRRGRSLFTWDGSMAFDRNAGRATFERNVRAANKPLGDPAITDVTADRLVAQFSTTGAERAADGGSRQGVRDASFEGDLRWAEALGNAVLRIEGEREVSADRLVYNAEGGVIEAASEGGGRVRVRDLMRGRTSTFEGMRWDLNTDTIRFMNPGSIVTPQ